jgi:ribonuclease HI
MSYSPSQRLRCPCCGEIFTLADAVPVEDAPVAAQMGLPEPAETQLASGTTMLPIRIVFDGGSIGNPGRGYGSYQLTVRGKAEQPKRLTFSEEHTSNEAEYDTLLEALEAVLRRAKDPRRVRLDIRGDSQLVINQVNGTWKAKDARMRERLEQVHALLKQFGGWTATWHRRSNSVKALGH